MLVIVSSSVKCPGPWQLRVKRDKIAMTTYKITRAAYIFVCLTVMSTVLFAHVTAVEKYTSEYDGIDIDEILINSRLRNQYVKCYMNTAPCLTAVARFMKDKLPEVIVTRCSKCTNKQVIFFNKITDWFTRNEPETWNRIIEKAIQDATRNKSN